MINNRKDVCVFLCSFFLFLFPSQGYDGTIDRFTTPDVRLTDKTTGDRLCADCMYRSHSLR